MLFGWKNSNNNNNYEGVDSKPDVIVLKEKTLRAYKIMVTQVSILEKNGHHTLHDKRTNERPNNSKIELLLITWSKTKEYKWLFLYVVAVVVGVVCYFKLGLYF